MSIVNSILAQALAARPPQTEDRGPSSAYSPLYQRFAELSEQEVLLLPLTGGDPVEVKDGDGTAVISAAEAEFRRIRGSVGNTSERAFKSRVFEVATSPLGIAIGDQIGFRKLSTIVSPTQIRSGESVEWRVPVSDEEWAELVALRKDLLPDVEFTEDRTEDGALFVAVKASPALKRVTAKYLAEKVHIPPTAKRHAMVIAADYDLQKPASLPADEPAE